MSALQLYQPLKPRRRTSGTDIKAETQGVSLCEWGINGTSGLPSREELRRSDSGRYQCRSDTWKGTRYDDFYLYVTEDASAPKRTLGPFIRSTFLPTTTPPQSLSSSSSPSSSETSKLPDEPAAGSDFLLYVGLTLVAKIILLSTPLVIFFKNRRASKSKGLPEERDYSSISMAKEVEVEYSEVHLLNDTTTLSNSAPCGHADKVIYPEFQEAVSSANQSDDSALYSNITLQQ
ncbi:uncharacterized protein LOC118566415 [Fundulus heteroclitus]|uniref:uncharacterized protein LOC118566415 n=1 Tax=Fundulus heteroclitus TaxID=8078 RepID=UPI00165BFAE3|nr:uncharacterized protein LOC118566415 [Fundulus heteroclitus]